MPTYTYSGPCGHITEHRCSISARPATLPCEEIVEQEVAPDVFAHVPCGQSTKQVIAYAPLTWIVNDGDGPNGQTRKSTVLNTPSSLGTTAGTVHSHGPKMATKIMSGPYGVTRPEPRYDNPIARNVQPEALSKHRRPK